MMGNRPASLQARALRLLSRREHSRRELATKLADYASAEEIDLLLDRLAELDLQSDLRCAQSLIRVRAPLLGLARVRHELKQRGIASDVIEHSLAEAGLGRADDAEEMARARSVWERKFVSAPADARDWARQARFLQSRGFSGAVIHTLLKEPRP